MPSFEEELVDALDQELKEVKAEITAKAKREALFGKIALGVGALGLVVGVFATMNAMSTASLVDKMSEYLGEVDEQLEQIDVYMNGSSVDSSSEGEGTSTTQTQASTDVVGTWTYVSYHGGTGTSGDETETSGREVSIEFDAFDKLKFDGSGAAELSISQDALEADIDEGDVIVILSDDGKERRVTVGSIATADGNVLIKGTEEFGTGSDSAWADFQVTFADDGSFVQRDAEGKKSMGTWREAQDGSVTCTFDSSDDIYIAVLGEAEQMQWARQGASEKEGYVVLQKSRDASADDDGGETEAEVEQTQAAVRV